MWGGNQFEDVEERATNALSLIQNLGHSDSEDENSQDEKKRKAEKRREKMADRAEKRRKMMGEPDPISMHQPAPTS